MFDNGFGRIFGSDTANDWNEYYRAWLGDNIAASKWDSALALPEDSQRELVRVHEMQAVKEYVRKGLANGTLEKVDLD